MYAWLLVLSLMQASSDRVIGLLSLPDVFGSRTCAPFEPRDVPLHSTADDGSRVAAIRVDRNWSFAPHGGCEGLAVSIHRSAGRELLPTLEYDYEMPAAIVLEQRSGWFRVRTESGSAWIKASTGDRFMPLRELYEEFIGMTRIDDRYTGRLLGAPGAAAGAAPAGRVAPGQPVQVLEIRDVDGRSYVRIEVMSHSLCTAGANGPPEIAATGWLPLHAETGEPTIWYSSRGC